MIEKREDVKRDIADSGLPHYMAQGMEHYLFDRVQPGSFLLAVFQNDLKQAALRADSQNLSLLGRWGLFMWKNVPSDCQGSEKKVAAWLYGKLDGE